MMLLQGHRSKSLSSDENHHTSESPQTSRTTRRDPKPWTHESVFTPYHSSREANLTPYNTMHMPRLDSPGSQERRAHTPIWEPLFMEDTPEQKGLGGKRHNATSMDSTASKQQEAGKEDRGTDYGCCGWKMCISLITANWMSRAM